MNARPFAPSSGRALAARGALRATREQTSHRARNRTDTELRSRPTRTRRRRRAAAADRRRQFFFAESGSGRNDRAAAGATALTLRRLELAGWSSGGIGLVAARASRARGSEKEVVNEVGYVFAELLVSFRHTPLLAIHGRVIRQRLAPT